jgi:hypothetical protein
MPIGRKIGTMSIKYINTFHCKTLQNLPKLGFFGLKIYHLATLVTRVTAKAPLQPGLFNQTLQKVSDEKLSTG